MFWTEFRLIAELFVLLVTIFGWNEMKFLKFNAIFFFTLLGSTAQAGSLQVFTDPEAWFAAVSDYEVMVEEFDLPAGPLVVGENRVGMIDITINGTEGGFPSIEAGGNPLNIDGSSFFFNDVGDTNGNLYTDFSFDSMIVGFGSFFTSTLTGNLAVIEVGGNTVNFSDHLSGSGDGFLGILSDMAFSQFRFAAESNSNLGEAFGVDNFNFAKAGSSEVPEPGTVLLLALGFGGVMLRKKMA